jgi:hypothetical protein
MINCESGLPGACRRAIGRNGQRHFIDQFELRANVPEAGFGEDRRSRVQSFS